MKQTKPATAMALLIAVALVILQNSAPVHVRLKRLTLDVPMLVMLFMTAAEGFLAGRLTALLVTSGAISWA